MDKIFTPETISPNPLPTSAGDPSVSASNTIGPATFPPRSVIADVVGSSIDSQQRRILGSYSFGVLGAISVGTYTAGVSGDIRISPSGIVGRNSSGVTTFTIDGTTGDASFYGTVTATAGLIGGFTLAVGYMYAGSGASTAGMSPADYPFWAGATYADRASAPFKVTPAGAITASSGTIGGCVLTSSTISTSSGNEKIVFDSGDYIRFYAGGTLRGSIRGATATGATGIVADCDLVIANNKSFMMKSSGGGATEYSGLGLATNDMWLTLGTANKLYVKNNAQDTNLFTVSTDRTFSEHDMYIGTVDDDHQVATHSWVDDNYVHK